MLLLPLFQFFLLDCFGRGRGGGGGGNTDACSRIALQSPAVVTPKDGVLVVAAPPAGATTAKVVVGIAVVGVCSEILSTKSRLLKFGLVVLLPPPSVILDELMTLDERWMMEQEKKKQFQCCGCDWGKSTQKHKWWLLDTGG